MTNRNSRATHILLGAFTIATLVLIAPATAQPGPGMPGRGGPGMMDYGYGPDMMMGPGMMRGRGMHGRMCSPRAAGLAAWRIGAVEQAIKPDDAQQKKLDAYKAAAAQATQTIRSACPTDWPATPTARLDLMEKRMEAMLQAIKTIRPAFDDFYNSLTDEQKAKLGANSRGVRRFWHWRDRW